MVSLSLKMQVRVHVSSYYKKVKQSLLTHFHLSNFRPKKGRISSNISKLTKTNSTKLPLHDSEKPNKRLIVATRYFLTRSWNIPILRRSSNTSKSDQNTILVSWVVSLQIKLSSMILSPSKRSLRQSCEHQLDYLVRRSDHKTNSSSLVVSYLYRKV